MKPLNFEPDYRQLSRNHDGREFGEEVPLHVHECVGCGEWFECESDDNTGDDTFAYCGDCQEENGFQD